MTVVYALIFSVAVTPCFSMEHSLALLPNASREGGHLASLLAAEALINPSNNLQNSNHLKDLTRSQIQDLSRTKLPYLNIPFLHFLVYLRLHNSVCFLMQQEDTVAITQDQKLFSPTPLELAGDDTNLKNILESKGKTHYLNLMKIKNLITWKNPKSCVREEVIRMARTIAGNLLISPDPFQTFKQLWSNPQISLEDWTHIFQAPLAIFPEETLVHFCCHANFVTIVKEISTLYSAQQIFAPLLSSRGVLPYSSQISELLNKIKGNGMHKKRRLESNWALRDPYLEKFVEDTDFK